MDNSILLSIEKTFADMLPKGWVGKYAAFMGNANGTVKANKYNDVYVIKHDRSVEVVRNTRVPNQAKLAVIVGFDDQNPTLLQVLREVNAYQKPPYSPIAEHADPNHTRWGRDPVFVSLQQVVDLLPYPESFTGMTVQLRGGNYYLNGDHVLDNQIVDFSAEIPASGACWVLAEVNDTKVITLRAGDTVASRELLKPENIPASVVDKLRLFAVKCYYGQTRIVQNKTMQDIYICHSAAGAASAGAADSVAWDDITGKPSVFPPDTDITDLIYMRKWVKVVDPSNNEDVSLGYEILDHWINTTTGDIFTCADNTDGAAVWTPNGSGAGGASGGLSGFCVDGTLAVVDEATSPVLITADTTISQWKMYLRTLGASGSTILDVILKRTGEADVSIFDDGVTDNRPEIQWNDTDHLLDADPLIVDFLAGDVLELNIDQVADGASDIVLLPVGVASLSSLEVTDGTTSVLHVDTLTTEGLTLTDEGGGNAKISVFEHEYYFIPFHAPDSVVGFGLVSGGGFGVWLQSSSAQYDEAVWNVKLPAGTYTLQITNVADNNRGFYHWYLDGVEVGSVDSYGSGTALLEISGGVVSASGSVEIKIKMDSKNGSSSAYYGTIFGLSLRKTA